MGEWRAVVAETTTGAVVADVDLAAEPQFDRALNDKGSWTCEVIIDERANRAVDFHLYTIPAWYSWVVTYDGIPVQGGPTWSHTFSETDRKLSVTGTGIAGFFSRRVVRNAGPHPSTVVQASNDLVYNRLSLRGIMASLVSDNMEQVAFGLPIEVPAPEQGKAERTYYGYDLAMLWDRMTDLAEVIDGPEFDFVPVLANDGLSVSWRMDIGGPLLGNQETPLVWDYGGALSAIDVDVNGADSPTSRVFVKGSGEERDLLVAFRQDRSFVDQGYPPLDFVDGDHTSVKEMDTLAAHAEADLAELSAPLETWSCTVRIDGLRTQDGVDVAPALGSWSLGDAPLFGVYGHPWIADGNYRRRVTGFSQDETATLTLTLAEDGTPVPVD